MLLTITKERVASGLSFGAGILESRDMKTVVLPLPVGSETPIFVAPPARASMHASKHDSWYGRNVMGVTTELVDRENDTGIKLPIIRFPKHRIEKLTWSQSRDYRLNISVRQHQVEY
jgi:hypothetical protein